MPVLSAQHIGGRVVIRVNVGVRDGRRKYSDVLGELREFSDRCLVVRTDDGAERKIDPADVVAAKPIPPRPARFSAIAGLERAAARHWPATDTEWLGDWLLRAADGWTNRANTVLALGEPGLPLDEALAYTADWYAARGLSAAFAVPLPLSRRLDAELAERGWHNAYDVDVRARELSDWTAPPDRGLPAVRVDEAPSEDWLGMTRARRGELPPVALKVLTGAPRTGFASVYEDGELIAIGRGTVSDGWLGLSAVDTAAHARRRGLATHVIDALVRWSGAERGYLQVEQYNTGALALYDGLGFGLHHTYRGRVPAAAATSS